MRPSNHPKSAWFAGAVVVASLFAAGALAKPVVKEDAAKAVSGWLNHPGRGLKEPLGNAVKETETFTDAAGNPQYHVVYLKPAGFVIVPADDLVEPIICFCPAGKYVASDKNTLGALVMRDIPRRLAMARANPPAAGPAESLKNAQQKWTRFRTAAAGPLTSPPSSVSDVRVAPLTQTTWSQGSVGNNACYNYYTPGPSWPTPSPGNANNDVCGCVATAMAQFMRFWQYPTAGVGTGSYTIYVNTAAYSADLIGGNGSGGPYDWADMVLSPGSVTATQCQAIGALCYDAGVAVSMEYTAGSSGAYMDDASTALKNVFQYSNSICGGDGNDDIGSGLILMLNSNLDAGLPCLLGIRDNSGEGHAVVPDGYGYDSGTLYHHVNLGWGGAYTAWYNLPTIQAGGIDFSVVCNCIYNIYTSGTGEVVSGRVLDGSGSPVSGATVQAVRTGGGSGPWTTTTNANGIYAFAKVPSNSTYTLSATAPDQTYADLTAATGRSRDGHNTTGDVWGKDFVSATNGTLTVQSTPPAGIVITSGTGDGGTTNYAVASITFGTGVNLVAPATDPTGYVFSQWTVNATAQTAGLKNLTFTMSAATTAVAQYTPIYTLTVQSAPQTGIVISSSTSHGGTTNYTVPGVASGTSVNLQAPATDPTGYTFSQWTSNGTAHTAGLKAITFTMTAGETAVAQYLVNGTLMVQSTPPAGIVIASSSGDGGTTNYAVANVVSGTSVNLAAPATDPVGYTFSQWTVNGTGQSAGQKSITFSMSSATTAVAQFSTNTYALTVQSTPPTGLSVGSSTSDGGTTNYTVPGMAYGTGVNLAAPGTDPAGYRFSQWTVNGTAQTAGQKSIAFTMPADTTAAAVYTAIPNSAVVVVVSSGVPGGTVIVPINLNSQGDENSLSFSLNWDTTVLTYVSSALGADDGGCSLITNETLTGQGEVGILIGQNAGVVFSSGAKQILLVTFSIKSGWVGTTPITFGNTPASESVSDVNANPLTSIWQGGQALCGLEGDMNLDGTVSAADWTAIGRIVVGLAPVPTGMAFQAADCAPRSTLGNGAIGAAAWTQVGRYAVGMDPQTAIGGPFAPAGTLDLESTPPGIAITSSTGHGGTTNCTMSGIASGTSVNLQAPATDPAGYTFSQWVVNGTLQTAGQKSITFTMTAGTLAVAQYATTAVSKTPAPAGSQVAPPTAQGKP